MSGEQKTSILTTDPKAAAAGAAGGAPNTEPKKDEKTATNQPDPKGGEAKGAANAGENKGGEKKADEKTAEIKYDLKLPEKHMLGAEAVSQITEIAKKNGMTNEAAQQVLEHVNASITAHETAIIKSHTDQIGLWVKMIQDDKVMGGDKFAETANDAYAATQRFATPELRKMLEETGYSNHPEMVRMMAKIGAAMRDSKIVTPTTPTTPTGGKTLAQALYPTKA